jgi:hypothetical protein
MASWNNVP